MRTNGTPRPRRPGLALAAAAALLPAFFATAVLACDIPVFRYALENWPSGPHRVLVVQRGPLAPADGEALQSTAGRLGLTVEPLDVGKPAPDDLAPLLPALTNGPLPRLALIHVNQYDVARVAWCGPLTAQNSTLLLEDANRLEIARRLVAGDSAVWVILEGTNAAQNKAAADLLAATLPKAEANILLPDAATGESYDVAPSAPIPLRVKFSIMSIPRSAPGATMLREMLAPLTSPEATAGDTLVTPVFGRGRAFDVARAQKLSEFVIMDVCLFLCGPCSCEIKEMNPGLDLFCPVNWVEAIFRGTNAPPVVLPPLTVPVAPAPPGSTSAPTAVAAAPASPSTPGAGAAAAAPARHAGGVTRRLATLATAGLALVACATWWLVRRRP